MAPRKCGEILANDSIFVLTGDERRIPFAMRKMREFPNADLYIIGVGAPHGKIDVSRPAVIESKSKSTYQNALAIKKIASEKKTGPIGHHHNRRSHESCNLSYQG